MIQNFPHPLTRPSLSRYFLHPSFLPSVYLIFVCLARLTSSPPLPIIFALTFTAPSMASSSTNPNILTALSEEESLIHDFDHISLSFSSDPNSFCLIFKLLSPRTAKPAWIEKAMSEAWTLRFPAQITEYHSGLFLATFQCDGDRRRVLEEQPWHFDKFLIVFTHPDVSPTPTPESIRYTPFWIQAHHIPFGRKSPQLAQFIADELGDLIEIYPLSLLENSGPFLRIRVLLDITKPLRRGMTIRFRSIHEPKWISFKHESLPNFCYFCGLMDHTYNRCSQYLLRCDNFSSPPILEYRDTLRASAQSHFKKNPFEISNATPFEELFPRSSSPDHSLQHAVNQFLRVHSPPRTTTITTSNTAIPTSPLSQTLPSTIPPPIMTISTITHIAKGKGIALRISSPPRTRPIGLVINEPSTQSSPTSSVGTRKHFTRQSTQVGDSVRSMLKRACAAPSEDAVVPSLSDVEHPLRKMSFCSWNARGLGSSRAFRHLSLLVKQHQPTLLFVMETKLPAGPGLSLKYKLHFDNVLEVPRQVIGDFNDYLSLNDRNSTSSPPSHAMHHFHNFLHTRNMTPLPHSGNKFTWRHGSILERLDWCTISSSWKRLFPHASLTHLGFYGSDHRALKLQLEDPSSTHQKQSRFHLENFLINDPSFSTLVRDSWCLPSSSSLPPLQHFLNKQSTCLSNIKPAPHSTQQISHLQSKLNRLLLKEEIFWKQRSRVAWLRAGDKNTRFFRQKASNRKRNNYIRGLTLPDGSITHDTQTIFTQFHSYYTDLFCSQGTSSSAISSILQGVTNTLSPAQSAFLAEEFTADEIKTTMFSLSGDKSPSPDVLANRLKSVLHSVISPNQSAFLTGRQITDNIVIANEIIHAIHSRKSGKLGWAAIKLDMEKAFDRVEWSFISHFLHHIGVPQRFTSLITKCLSTVTYQLSLNGNLSNVFSSSRGIRQGNPLSPYLFLIVAEGFSAAIRLHEEAALFSGIKICRGAPSFSHLLFADDSMVFVPISTQSSEAINNILLLYFQASGQSVNRDKSSILFSPNTSPDSQSRFRSSLLLNGEGFISKYLGVPHCVGRVKNSIFHYLIQKVSSKLNVWNEKLFSRAVNSTYHLAQSTDLTTSPSTSDPNPFKDWWKTLWTLKIPPKIKHFTWKAFNHLLPCALNLFHKHAIPSSCCSYCGGSVESGSHALLHCPRVKTIWHHSNFKQFFVDFRRLDIRDFYLHSLTLIPRAHLPLFLGIIWQIWNIRNAHLFQKPSVIDNVQDIVLSFLQDYQDAQIHSSVSSMTNNHSPAVLDHILLPSTTALFVDAALSTNAPATGIGMVFMQGLSHIQQSARIFKPGASSPIFAEAQALCEGLQWCLSSNLTPRFIFSDCINLVSKVNGNWHDYSPLSTLILQIRTFLSASQATLL
uniref:Reverse transcriptase domain-containing protein n=1 Tax=Cannabis sativa TaxID=3483 RepID=A0A803PSF4_CANSA